MNRGLCDYRFQVEVEGGCGDGPLLASGLAALEYCVEAADPDSGVPRPTFDVWVADVTIDTTTCPDCDRALRLTQDEQATVRARAAMALMTAEYSSLQQAAQEDHGA
ncbi:hypothetical protein UFOVP62_43 [uncultured Caudovirales phage]|uniref:Uncharacterized protein n=1 Tax=uncultured Caudovirales phage TaxID=2100421 RepID=A0A6J5KUF6_9CAUD|nr:hypothetical protein UFOVP62_43 [uncultured Caudovirales phage]